VFLAVFEGYFVRGLAEKEKRDGLYRLLQHKISTIPYLSQMFIRLTAL